MIVDKPPLPGDEVEIQDAPPSYDALEGIPPVPPRDEKAAGPSSPLPPTPPDVIDKLHVCVFVRCIGESYVSIHGALPLSIREMTAGPRSLYGAIV